MISLQCVYPYSYTNTVKLVRMYYLKYGLIGRFLQLVKIYFTRLKTYNEVRMCNIHPLRCSTYIQGHFTIEITFYYLVLTQGIASRILHTFMLPPP